MLPTRCTRRESIPSRRRFSFALVRMREQHRAQVVGEAPVDLLRHASSKLRRPASTCATGIPVFAAASAPASVELTSPATITSRPLLEQDTLDTGQARAVCSPCVPESIPRYTSGRGQAELLEEHARHVVVVVLVRVHEHEPRLGSHAVQRTVHRSHLHEVRSCPDDEAQRRRHLARLRNRLVRRARMTGRPSARAVSRGLRKSKYGFSRPMFIL